MKTATFVRDVSDNFNGTAHLFKVNPPIAFSDSWDEETLTTEYIVASSLTAAFDTGRPETFLFPTNEEGVILDWGELPGSQRGTTNIDAVLTEAGYEVIR